MTLSFPCDTIKRLEYVYDLLCLNGINWLDPDFSPDKGYLACLASKIAYEHIPGIELTNSDRCSIVPCEAYQSHVLFALQGKQYFSSVLDYLHLEGTHQIKIEFFIQSPLVVAVGIRVGKIGLVALRGTELAFNLFGFPKSITRAVLDLDADLDFRQKIYNDQYRYRFDQGFYEACDSIYDIVRAEVVNKFPPETPVYLAGHSLGGSMAAIMYARWFDDHEKIVSCNGFRSAVWLIQKPVACYTFGMPRYANPAVISDFALPWHILAKGDSIPTVPPRAAGYADLPSIREYCLLPESGTVSPSSPGPKGDSMSQLKYIVNFFRGVPNHMMECYLSGLHAYFVSHHPDIVSPEPHVNGIIEDDECICINEVSMKKNILPH
jgi:hypothetical protein